MNITVNDPWGQTMTVRWLTNYSTPFIFRPTGNGSSTHLSVYGAGCNYQAVNEVVADDASTYVYSISGSNYVNDTYTISNHSTQSLNISNVTVHAKVYKYGNWDLARATYYKIILKTEEAYYNGTEHVFTSGASWGYIDEVWPTNPNTGLAWTWDEIDSLEIGISMAYSIVQAARCTQLYAEINPTSTSGWYEFGRNTSVNNGTYTQSSTIFDSWNTNYYWKVQVNDSSDTNTTDVLWFFTGKQSKIVITGSRDISGYLLMQVQFYNETLGEWVVANDTINETAPRTITVDQQLALDTIFNGLVNTSDLLTDYGEGTYRVYAAFRDSDGDPLMNDYGCLLEASHLFTITES